MRQAAEGIPGVSLKRKTGREAADMTKTFLLYLLTFALLPCTVLCVEPGGRLSLGQIREKARPVVTVPSAPARRTQAVVFLDAATPDAPGCLRMLEELKSRLADLPEKDRVDFYVLACSPVRAVREALNGITVSFGVGSDENRLLFGEFVPGEILFPLALVMQEGKVLWKGSPVDLESILTLIRNDRFDLSRQVKIERIRKEMQMAVQASLPDVVLRCADDILKLQPGDSIAVRAKLYVYESTGRFSEALTFARKNAEDNPGDVNQTLLFFDYLRRQGDPAPFAREFRSALMRFDSSPEALYRILVYSLEALPFGWLPPADAASMVEKVRPAWGVQPLNRRIIFLFCEARVRYLLCDLSGALRAQEEACRLSKGTEHEKEAARILEYYRSIPSRTAMP